MDEEKLKNYINLIQEMLSCEIDLVEKKLLALY